MIVAHQSSDGDTRKPSTELMSHHAELGMHISINNYKKTIDFLQMALIS